MQRYWTAGILALSVLCGSGDVSAHEPPIKLRFVTHRFGFHYGVYKDGAYHSMDYYGTELRRLVGDVPDAVTFAERLTRERRQGLTTRILGHVAMWTSLVVLIANADSDSAAVGLLGTAGIIGGLIAASTGKARSRRAYRHLFNAVNAYNEQRQAPFSTTTNGDQPDNSSPSEHEEGSFPPGAP